MQELLMYITKWKKPIWKGYILYSFNYYGLLEKEKKNHYGDSKISVVAKGLGRKDE